MADSENRTQQFGYDLRHSVFCIGTNFRIIRKVGYYGE